jgi:DNA-binding transcriptional MerR regulator
VPRRSRIPNLPSQNAAGFYLDSGIDSNVYHDSVKARKEIALAVPVSAGSGAMKPTQPASPVGPRPLLRPSELARAAGVSTDTLRHYERKGVLPIPPRSRNRYRTYPASALDRVRLIRRALAMGFTLDELASILKVRDKGGAPCHQVRDLAAAKLSAIENQLNEMIRLRDDLRVMLRDWDSRLSAAPAGGRAALLEALPDLPSMRTARSAYRLNDLRPGGRRKGNKE